MTTTERVALAQRLGEAELALQGAMRGLDGSPDARTRLADARTEYLAAEREALVALGAQPGPDAIELLASSQATA
ncbi:hypothetical protein [Corallococcus sp. AB038B]|uniref:hypothetical protein n=1 Tax=Corallococcus sp. AB038B TaxID=2316718 RepID=UPI000EBBC06A|nr:hypothetical protein [Corallococcus sp. AB038B]RKH93584.1 hypothetical protein D7Y04_39965 [Corallococcus sp. AB038B]